MIFFNNLKMVYKIMLPVAVLMATTLLGIEYFATSKSSDAIESVARREVTALANEYGAKVYEYIAETQHEVEAVANLFAGLNNDDVLMDRAMVISMFKSLVKSNPAVVGACIAWEPDAFDGKDSEYAGKEFHDSSGRFVPYIYRDGGTIKVEPLVGYDTPGDGDYYQIPKQRLKTYITPPYSYNVGGKEIKMVSLCSPIISEGVFKGVVCADLPIDKVNEMLASISPYGTGYVALMSSDGSIFYHPSADIIGKNMFDVAKFEDEQGLKSAMRGGEGFQEIRVSAATGDVSMAQYVPIKFTGTGQSWYLVVSAPMDKILADATALNFDLLVIGCVALILVLIAIFFVARSISKPIVVITDAAKEVAGGNFDVRLDERMFGGELYDLNISLRDMLVSLVENISNADKMREEAQEQTDKAQVALKEADEARAEAETAKREGMLQAAERLSGIVSQVSSATQELTAQIDESSRGSESQRERTAESATAMEQMNASVMEVARNAGQAADLADNAKSEAENGGEIVNDVVNRINRVQEMTVEMETGLGKLGEQAEGIGQIMNVITDIADQTNLLALNAAIEAARAGEAGRGFAVVADEVRKLAEKTMDATGQVGRFINAIQKGTRDNIEGMSRAAGEVEQSTEFASKAGEALESIVNTVEETAEQVRSIATASEEQSAASEQINRGIDEVNLIANDNAQAMRESAAAVEELMNLGEQLSALIEELRNA
ncbi:methyl-accepting chemotaxis protein [Maridesulfovibrio sp.]|uniref:methyl-accepting chemotaxis protein n=1 Tax=Maridesulfovibrio sp. TaxID=2795000 RepID=UPI003AFFEB77